MSVLSQGVSILRHETANDPEDKYDHQIKLVDHTRPREEEEDASGELSQAPTAQPDDESLRSPSVSSPVSHTWTHGTLRGELAKRKYRKWQEDRVADEPTRPRKPSLGVAEERDPDAEEPETPQSPQKLPSRRDTLRRKRYAVKDSVKDVIRGRHPKHVYTHADSVFDVLWENERGAFIFGIPRFSSKSLLNFDPPAWQTPTFHPSPVNITNAQLPDPSWVWAEGWKNWYVDMSGDVDEEGWRYSFAFGQRGRWAWHGTHPWFHSFVRRRRWVRLRVKRGHPASGEKAPKTLHEAHMLNAEYFTIHNAARGESIDGESYTGDSRRQSAITSKRWSNVADEEPPIEEVEVQDIPTLMKRVRKAAIDREKIAALRTFLDQGGQELFYLAENMHDIMSLLVFQSSRRQLLTMLLKKYEDVTDKQKRDRKKKRKEKETSEASSQDTSEKDIENLRNAVEAADGECKRLEYWSDIRDVVRNGEVVGAADEGKGWGPEWKGLNKSGADSREAPNRSDSDEEEKAKSPVGQTTIFAEDVDTGEENLEELDGASERGQTSQDTKGEATEKKERSNGEESPAPEAVKSPGEEHPYDPDIADDLHEPGGSSESQGRPDSGEGVD